MSMSKDEAATLKAWKKNGQSIAKAAKKLGIPASTCRDRLNRAQKWTRAPQGQKEAINNSGLDINSAKHGWRKVQNDDGSSDSVFWKAEIDPEVKARTLDEIIEKMNEQILPAPALIKPPKAGDDELMAVFPVADLHIGLLTCEEEVGMDWDTRIAKKVFEEAFSKIVERTRGAGTAVLAQLGDLTHTNDQLNVTPGHKHQLDADTRWFMINRRAVEIMKFAIDMLREKYPNVVYRGSRGNHDTDAHVGITSALYERYLDTSGVTVDIEGMDFFSKVFGENLILTHHGDKVKPERMATFIPEQYRKEWGQTSMCTVYSGHVHHMWSKEIGGVWFQGCGTIIPRDAHAFSNGYSSRRTLISDLYHIKDGRQSQELLQL